MARRIATLVLILCFVPAFELVERALGVTEHTAHADGLSSEDRSPPGPEHGCAALMHTCGCAASHAGRISGSPPAATAPPGRPLLVPVRDLALADRGADAPPVPPPNLAS